MTTAVAVAPIKRTAHDPDIKWAQDETGEWILPPLIDKFMDWTLTEIRDPLTLTAWCKENSVAERSTRRWRTDDRFKAIWKKRAESTFASPERTAAVINNLYTIATTRTDANGVKAAVAYMQYINAFTPKQIIQLESDSTEGISDEMLRKFAAGEIG